MATGFGFTAFGLAFGLGFGFSFGFGFGFGSAATAAGLAGAFGFGARLVPPSLSGATRSTVYETGAGRARVRDRGTTKTPTMSSRCTVAEAITIGQRPRSHSP